jgi:hypothetical protein
MGFYYKNLKMKYSAAILLFIGAISFTEAKQSTELVQVIEANGMTAAVESESDSESDDELLQVKKGDTGIIDATTPGKGQCVERLWESADEMEWQMDQFSRKFNMQNYLNAMEIAKELKIKPPRVHSWELLDGSFSFPRVRRYFDVQENMDMIEHFQDNLNTNISNLKNVQNFIRVGTTVVGQLNEKYHDGEFSDPSGFDPREAPDVTWATADI